MKYKTVTVTGASGFVGGHIVQTLIQKGYSVQAVYRREKPPSRLTNLESDACSLHRIDLQSGDAPEQLPELLQRSDAVIHAAARTGDWGSLREFVRNNYTPTLMLLDAAKIAGCGTFIYIGTISVHGFGPHRGTTEEGPYYRLRNPYQISKRMAEDAVIKGNSPDMRTAVIRPGNVYGPADTTTMFPIFDAIERGIMGYLGSGKTLTCPVYIDDLVNAVIRAMENDVSTGEIFNIVGPDRVTWEEYLEECAELLHRPALKIHLAPFPAKIAAAVLQGVFSLFRIRSAPPISFYRISQMTNDYHFSSSKAESLLGYRPTTDYKQGLAATAADYLGRKSITS